MSESFEKSLPKIRDLVTEIGEILDFARRTTTNSSQRFGAIVLAQAHLERLRGLCGIIEDEDES